MISARLERWVSRNRWVVAGALVCVAGGWLGVALGVPLADQFELEGNIVDEAAPAPDWESLFVVDSSPDGNVTGLVMPLPGNGVIAGFVHDELAISGLDKKDCSVFARGNKNGDLIADWEFKSGSTPPKDDLSNVMAFLRDDGSGNLELYMALERYAENGDSHVDFEINQGGVGLVVDQPELQCPGKGHFTGERQTNDLLVAVDFERGGDIGVVRIFRYLNASDLELLVEETVDTTGLFCNTATTAGNIQIPADTICAVNNDGMIDGGPWANFNRSDNKDPVLNLPKNAFTEIGIRLNDLPGALGTGSCIRSINVKTRSSQSITSELKDFALIEFDTCSDLAGRKVQIADDGTCDTIITPLSGWEIRLLDASGELITTDGDGNPLTNPACTDETGAYSFSNLPNGAAYTVCEIVPDRSDPENFNWLPCEPAEGNVGSIVTTSACAGQNGGTEFCYDPFGLVADTSGLDFHNFKQVITCSLAAVKYCDVDGDGTLDLSNDTPLDGFCLCITQLVDGTPDSATTQCGVTTSGAFSPVVSTGFTYRVEEDLTGAACVSADLSAGWVATTGAQDIEIAPAAGDCGVELGNTSVPVIDCDAGDVSFPNDAGDCDYGFCFTPTSDNECGGVTVACTAAGPGGPVTLTRDGEAWCGEFPATCPAPGVTTVTCTTTTDASQTSECSFDVTISDNEKPLITCSADVTISCEDPIPVGEASATDNCDPDPAISLVEGETPGACANARTITRTWTATDDCGNVSEACVQTITIVDNTPPTITCPSDITFECDAVGDFGSATATDNCDPPPTITLTEIEIPGACPEERTVTRVFTATDACGLTDECTQIVRVEDTTAPVVTCPADRTFECEDIGDFGEPTITDNCDPDPLIEVTVIEIPGNCSQPASGGAAGVSPPPRRKTLEVSYTVTDGQTATAAAGVGLCGNVTICTQIIEIIDTVPPTITSCPSDATVNCNEEFVFKITTEDTCEGDLTIDCTFTDAADPDRFVAEELSSGVFQLELTATTTVSVVCTGSDICDNTSAGCAFEVSATCNQACSPGFWRNNLAEWCLIPLNPKAGYCFEGPATKFLDAFGFASCAGAPPPSSFHDDMTLHAAASSSGGDDQTLFHGSAALLSAHTVSFPVQALIVQAVMKDACTGSTDFDGQPVSWGRAFDIFKTWNAVEAEGGCPFSSPAPSTKPTNLRSLRR